MTCGIYILVFEETDKVYIGQSKNIENRFKQHIISFNAGTSSLKMTEAFSTYGTPSLNILYVASEYDDLASIETEFIIKYNSILNGFNTMLITADMNKISEYSKARSTQSSEALVKVLNLLIDSNLYSFEYISKETNVPITIISQISASNVHLWLKVLYPEKYIILEKINGNRKLLRTGAYKLPSTSHKYSKEQYIQVLDLAVSNIGAKLPSAISLSKITGVGIDVIRDTLTLRRHSWLANASPVSYNKLKQFRKK